MQRAKSVDAYIDQSALWHDETKQKRVAKILPMITAGVSLNDKYRR